MNIHTFHSNISDNILYLVEDDGDLLLVDPYDSDQMIGAAQSFGADRIRILTTHGHPDHAGGNAAVSEALGCEVLASGHDSMFDVKADTYLRHGDKLEVGGSTWEIYFAPGHTEGHLVAYTPGHVISGDVYFVGGAGNCRFGGDPADLHRTYTERLANFPGETIFYPGHDYARKNWNFCLEVEPDNSEAAARLEALDRGDVDEPVLTTLAEERAYNPFHRTAEEPLQKHLSQRYAERWNAAAGSSSERAFRVLRSLRDSY